MAITRLGIVAAALALASASTMPLGGQTTQPAGQPAAIEEATLDVAPVSDLDERLFAAYAVEQAYRRFPGAQGEAALRQWIDSTRQMVDLLLQEERSHVGDADLKSLLGDCLKFSDACNRYLTHSGSGDGSGQGNSELAVNLLDAAGDAKTADDLARMGGVSNRASGVGGVIVGVLDFVVRQRQTEEEHEAARSQALARQRQDLDVAFDLAQGRAERLCRALAARWQWPAEQVPFGASAGGTDLKQWETLVRQQPRNPFALAAYAGIRLSGESPRTVMDDAQRLAYAAQLVPQGCDSFRLAFLEDAACLATDAAMSERNQDGGSFSQSGHKLGPQAVRYWRTVATLRQGNLEPSQSWALAKALGCAGRFADAVAEANKVLDWLNQSGDNDFVYEYVRLTCLAQCDLDQCLSNLKIALLRDPVDVDRARHDPDLAELRRQKGEALDDLLRVKCIYGIHYGIWNDDVTVTNHSAFALTNLSVVCNFHQHDKVWTTGKLTAPLIGPGQTCTFSDCISIPGSWFSSSQVDMHCDQSEGE